MPCEGVTSSSASFCSARASAPSTFTLFVVSPVKSRLNRDRLLVAFAVIVATPSSTSVAGS
jgi:hypothetical protein